MISSIIANIPALIVTLPMFVAPVLAMIPSSRPLNRFLIWQTAHLCVGLSLAGCVYLFVNVYNLGALNYFFGAWPPPIGIEYEATKLNTLLLVLISGMAFILMLFGRKSVGNEVDDKKTGLFYAVFLMLVSGLMGMVITNDIFNIYVFLEISSLATYALVAMGHDRRALTASYNYLIVGTIGGTLFLTGIAFLYIMTGSLNISDIAYQLGLIQNSRLQVAAIVFLFIGLAIKSAIVPLAGWLPRVYAYSPSFVASFIAAVSTKVALYLLAKVLYVLFGRDVALGVFALGDLLIIVSVVAILFGGIAAIMQSDFKRTLAFSSISNIGYIVLGIGVGSKEAVTAAIILFVAHAFAKSGLFVIAGLCNNNIRGLKATAPMLAALLVLFGFSLIGVPLTLGFVPKWYLLTAASGVQGNMQYLVFTGVIGGSVLAAVYVWRLIEQAYFTERTYEIQVGWEGMTTLVILAIFTITLGVWAEPFAQFVNEMAGEFAK
jgi:multicomponent Na+:H+ antiporter subunit D